MEVKQADDLTTFFEPVSKDESALVGMLFERITEIFPEWPMGDRTDHAMKMFAVVKKWGHNLDLTSDSHRMVEVTLPIDDSINGVASGDLFPLPAHVADTTVE